MEDSRLRDPSEIHPGPACAYRAALWLLGALVVYALSWAIVVLASLSGHGPEVWLGLDLGNVTREAPLHIYALFFTQIALFCVAFLVLVRRRRAALWWFAAGAVTHAAMWLSMTTSPYYAGEFGYGVLVIEAAITLALVLARHQGQLH